MLYSSPPFQKKFIADPISKLRFGRVLAISDDFLGDFPRVLATWYHFSGNFHRYVLSFRLGVPIPDPFLEDAAMASPERRADAFFGVGNTSQVYQPCTNSVALYTGYNSVLYWRQTPMEKWYQVARTLGKSPKKSSEIARTPPYLKVRRGVGDF